MNDRCVTLTVKDQKRLMLMSEVDVGRLTAREAASLLGMSLRQTRRLIAVYRQDGVAGLVHGNRGRPSPRKIPAKVQEELLRLMRTDYKDSNDCHLTDNLREKHGINVSRSTVRRADGKTSPRKRRSPRHRSRRRRYPQQGML
jgi:transposase